jgi:hypothetical protein
MDAKQIADAVKKGIQEAEKLKASGLTEAEQAEVDMLTKLQGMSPRDWEDQVQEQIPTFNP